MSQCFEQPPHLSLPAAGRQREFSFRKSQLMQSRAQSTEIGDVTPIFPGMECPSSLCITGLLGWVKTDPISEISTAGGSAAAWAVAWALLRELPRQDPAHGNRSSLVVAGEGLNLGEVV